MTAAAANPEIIARVERDIAAEEKRAGWRRYHRELSAVLSPPGPITPPPPAADRWVSWFDDCGFYISPADAAEITAADHAHQFGTAHPADLASDHERATAFGAEGAFFAHCKEKTGDIAETEALKKFHRDQAELLKQSETIAEKMHASGYDCYRQTPFELWRYYIHSQQIEKLPMFRRTCFVPYVAAQIRAPILSALEFWLSRNPFARFWTFTAGPRVALCDVRAAVKDLHARLGDLAEFLKRWKIRFVFRSTELGTPEQDATGNNISAGNIERDVSGQLWFHPHAHCVIELTGGQIAPPEWAKMLSAVHEFWQAIWFEGGAIRNARECCKYVTKPGAMLKLSGPELVALQKQLFRLKLVQPLGALAEEIKSRETTGHRLIRKRTPDGTILAVVRNWNRHGKKTKTESDYETGQKLGAPTARGSLRIVARCVPGYGLCGIAEPRVVIMATRGDFSETAVRSNPLVSDLIMATRDEFLAGQALAAINVHTRTPTPKPAGYDPAHRPRGKPKRAPLGATARGFL